MGLYGLNTNLHIPTPYHKANNQTILFDVVDHRSLTIMVHTTPSDNKIFTAIYNEINQNPTVYHKELLVVHQQYGHTIKQW